MNAIRWACGLLMLGLTVLAWKADITPAHPLFTQVCFAAYVLADALRKSLEGK